MYQSYGEGAGYCGQGCVGRVTVGRGSGAWGRSMIVTQAIRLLFRLATTLGMLNTLSITALSMTAFSIQRHFAECRIFYRNAECRYAECHFPECRCTHCCGFVYRVLLLLACLKVKIKVK